MNMRFRSRDMVLSEVFNFVCSLFKQRAQGRPGARRTRGLVCNGQQGKYAHEQTGLAEAVRPSLRNGLTAYAVLSLVTGFLTPSPAGLTANLTPALGASGPHGFTGAAPAVRPHAFACGDKASAHRSLPPRS